MCFNVTVQQIFCENKRDLLNGWLWKINKCNAIWKQSVGQILPR